MSDTVNSKYPPPGLAAYDRRMRDDDGSANAALLDRIAAQRDAARAELAAAHKLMDKAGIPREAGGEPLRLASRVDLKLERMQSAREAVEDELEGCRALLGMATAFDAGPLLADAPDGWELKIAGNDIDWENRSKLVQVFARNEESGGGWAVYVSCGLLSKKGDWVATYHRRAKKGCRFESPAAALAALEAWRAARRAEFAGQGGVVVGRREVDR